MSAAAGQQSLYARIGGKAAVDAAVDIFYAKLMKDQVLAPFFAGVDLAKLQSKQKIFVAYALGGLPDYPGASLRDAHKNLVLKKGLNDSHFDKVAGHFISTLKELNVPPALITETMTIISSTRKDVLNR